MNSHDALARVELSRGVCFDLEVDAVVIASLDQLEPDLREQLQTITALVVGDTFVPDVDLPFPARHLIVTLQGGEPSVETAARAVEAALRRAEQLDDVRSLAFPSIGALPDSTLDPVQVAHAVLTSVLGHLSESTRLERVAFGLTDETSYGAYRSAYEQSGGAVTSVRVAGFLPSVSGFHFGNVFPHEPEIQITLPLGRHLALGDAAHGVSGGMAFTVRDYFDAGRLIPVDTQPPAAGTPLYRFLIERQLDSLNLPLGIVRYLELMQPHFPDVGPGFGLPGRASVMVNDEWPLIKSELDAWHPVPLGLVQAKSDKPEDLSKNRQVLAYGYDLLGPYLTLWLYDPNHPDRDDVSLQFSIADAHTPKHVAYWPPEPAYCVFRIGYTPKSPPPASPRAGRYTIERAIDEEASKLDLSAPPEPTTVVALGLLPRPVPWAVQEPFDTRNAPVEFTIYTLRATLVSGLVQDGALQLVIADPTNPSATMIAKLPLTGAAGDHSRHPKLAAMMRTAEAQVLATLSNSTSEEIADEDSEAEWMFNAAGVPSEPFGPVPLTGTAQITGVGYFAAAPGQPGMAPNGLQLTPLLGFRAVGCGVSRRAVKTLADGDATLIDVSAGQRTSVAALLQLERPLPTGDAGPAVSRIAPAELTVFDLIAKLREAYISRASDLTLVVEDHRNANLTMLVRVPDPDCVATQSGFALVLQQAREVALQRLGAEVQWLAAGCEHRRIPLSDTVRISAPGFWDAVHGQIGMAANGVTLHPLLSIAVVPPFQQETSVDAVLDRLSFAAEDALHRAETLRRLYGASLLFTEFLLAGLYARQDGQLPRLLQAFAPPEVIAGRVAALVDLHRRAGVAQASPLEALAAVGVEVKLLSHNLRSSLEAAGKAANSKGSAGVRQRHLLTGLLATPESVAAKWLSETTGQPVHVLRHIVEQLEESQGLNVVDAIAAIGIPDAYVERSWTSWPAVAASLEAAIAQPGLIPVFARSLSPDAPVPLKYRDRGWMTWPDVVSNLERTVADLRRDANDPDDDLRAARALARLILAWHSEFGTQVMAARNPEQPTDTGPYVARLRKVLSLDLDDLPTLRVIANEQVSSSFEWAYGQKPPAAMYARFLGLAPTETIDVLGRIGEEITVRLNRAASSLSRRAGEHRKRYVESGNAADLTSAVDELRQAEPLRYRPAPLALGDALVERFRLLGQRPDLDAGLEALARALEGAGNDPADQASALAALGSAYEVKFSAFGNESDLEQSIDCLMRALALTPATALLARATIGATLGGLHAIRIGGIPRENLERAIEFLGNAIEVLRPTGQRLLAQALVSLGLAWTRHASLMESDGDRKRASDCIEEALKLLEFGPPTADRVLATCIRAELIRGSSPPEYVRSLLEHGLSDAMSITRINERTRALLAVVEAAVRLDTVMGISSQLIPLRDDPDERIRGAVEAALRTVAESDLAGHLQRLSDGSRTALFWAELQRRGANWPTLTSELLIAGLYRYTSRIRAVLTMFEDDSVVRARLQQLVSSTLGPQMATARVGTLPVPAPETFATFPLGSQIMQVIGNAAQIADRRGSERIHPRHLLAALITDENDAAGAWVCATLEIDRQVLRQLLVDTRGDDVPLLEIRRASARRQAFCVLHGISGAPTALVFSPDGKLLLSAHADGNLNMWRAVDKKHLRTARLHQTGVHDLAVTPDGRWVVTASGDSTLKVFDVASGSEWLTLSGHDTEATSVVVSPDSRRAVSGSNRGAINIWDLQARTEPRSIDGHTGAVDALAFTADGQLLLSGSQDGTAKAWDFASGRQLSRVSHPDAVMAIQALDDAHALSAAADGTMKRWDMRSGAELRVWRAGTTARAMAVTPAGPLAVVGSAAGMLSFWDVESGSLLLETRGSEADVSCLTISEDGQWLAAGSQDGTLRLWELEFVADSFSHSGGAESRIETHTWYVGLETDVEEETVVGASVELTLRVTPDVQASSVPLRVPVSAMELTVYMEAPGFQLEGEHVRSVMVVDGSPRLRNVTFLVRPLASGLNQVRILVYPGGRVEGITPAELHKDFVVAAPVSLPAVSELIDPRAIRPPYPDVILYITLEQTPNGQQLGVHITCPALKMHRASLAPLLLTAEDAAGLREGATQAAADAICAAPPDVLASLRAFGAALFDELVPRDHALRRIYWNIARLAAATRSPMAWLIVSDRTAVLPWEMVCAYSRRSTGEMLYDDFLADKFMLTQWVGREGITLHADLPLGRIDLAHYQQHERGLDLWREALGGEDLVGCEDRAGHLALMRPGSRYYGLHFLRFGGAGRSYAITRADLSDAGHPGDRTQETDSFLRDQRLDLTLRRPLVGVSVIESQPHPVERAGPNGSDDFESGWVLPLLHAGATAITGPRWPVSGEVDRLFLKQLHSALRSGAVLGAAVGVAREHVRLGFPDRSDWLAYSCFGHPWCEPYFVRPAEGFMLFEALDHSEGTAYVAGRTYQFRATYRAEPPAWYQGRLREPVASMRGKNVSVMVVPMVGGAIATTQQLQPIPPGEDYHGIVPVTIPLTEGRLSVLVRFQEDQHELQTFVLDLEPVAEEDE